MAASSLIHVGRNFCLLSPCRRYLQTPKVGIGKHSAQIHLMGAEGKSPVARSEKEDPTIPHVALAVEDIQEAKKTLDQEGVWYWAIQGLVGNNSDQVFVRDPFGNVIELHQIGTCRCNKAGLET